MLIFYIIMEYPTDLYLCADCAKDQLLSTYIKQTSTIKEKCSICKRQNTFIIRITNNPTLQQIFKALIRYYFTENLYNHHFGGDSIEGLFNKENPILNHEIINGNSNEENLETYDIIWPLIETPYEDFDKGVSLFMGSEYGYFADTIPNSNSWILSDYIKKLQSINYFDLEEEAIQFFLPYKDRLLLNLKEKECLYRARIGVDSVYIKVVDIDEYPEIVYFPFVDKDISAPPPLMASAGRLNRKGVSFLYLSNSIKTAISEIKPHPGQIVSLATFKSKKELLLIDLTTSKFEDFWLSDKDINMFIFLKNLNNLFSIPIAPNENSSTYSVTQFFSNVFRLMNFDGAIYKSSVEEGDNFLFFNADNFEYIESSSECKKICSLEYKFNDVNFELEKSKEPYVQYFKKSINN